MSSDTISFLKMSALLPEDLISIAKYLKSFRLSSCHTDCCNISASSFRRYLFIFSLVALSSFLISKMIRYDIGMSLLDLAFEIEVRKLSCGMRSQIIK